MEAEVGVVVVVVVVVILEIKLTNEEVIYNGGTSGVLLVQRSWHRTESCMTVSGAVSP